MSDRIRQNNARSAAEQIAPRPNGSVMTYGLVGIALAGLGMAAFGQFYAVDILAYPLLVVGLMSFAFASGIGLRKARQIRHHNAYKAEYSERSSP
ncbi:hypothetical protein [Devosia nitrariae]|uniref:UsfY protein n=1 Tax=Devosia nitrariae TaxID=2071872 RepID=A0ABQ5W6A6_9HYPH|nr:hypothetical protein [Devosia nitrariae]GLQ55476.1 hypothetical protein GCM10010862_27350 [Devosia nitrariae]